MQCVRQEPSDIPETLLLSPERSIRKLLFARHQCSDSGYQSFRSICTKELLFKYQTQALQQSPHYKVDSSSSALFHSGSDLRFFFCEASVFPFTVQFFSVYSTNEDRRCDDHWTVPTIAVKEAAMETFPTTVRAVVVQSSSSSTVEHVNSSHLVAVTPPSVSESTAAWRPVLRYWSVFMSLISFSRSKYILSCHLEFVQSRPKSTAPKWVSSCSILGTVLKVRYYTGMQDIVHQSLICSIMQQPQAIVFSFKFSSTQ